MTHTVIVQVIQAIGHIDTGERSPLDRKVQPLLGDGYHVTHVSTCSAGGNFTLTTVILEKKEDEK